MSTDADVAAAQTEINRRAAQMVRQFVGTAWELLVQGTPVDTLEYTDEPGVLRGNWNFGVGADDETFDPSRTNAHGPVPDLPDVPLVGQDIYLSNHTPYAEVVEYGGYPVPVQRGSWNRATRQYVVKSVGGYSQQAPAGWVRLTAAALEPVAERIIADLRGLGAR